MQPTSRRQQLANDIHLKPRDRDVVGENLRQMRNIARQRQPGIAPELACVVLEIACVAQQAAESGSRLHVWPRW